MSFQHFFCVWILLTRTKSCQNGEQSDHSATPLQLWHKVRPNSISFSLVITYFRMKNQSPMVDFFKSLASAQNTTISYNENITCETNTMKSIPMLGKMDKEPIWNVLRFEIEFGCKYIMFQFDCSTVARCCIGECK